MTTKLTHYKNDGWDDADSADDRVIQGTLIKCVDGHWTDRDKRAIPSSTRLLALIDASVASTVAGRSASRDDPQAARRVVAKYRRTQRGNPARAMGARARRRAAAAMAKAIFGLPARLRERRAVHLHQLHCRRPDRGRKSQRQGQMDAGNARGGCVPRRRAFECAHENPKGYENSPRVSGGGLATTREWRARSCHRRAGGRRRDRQTSSGGIEPRTALTTKFHFRTGTHIARTRPRPDRAVHRRGVSPRRRGRVRCPSTRTTTSRFRLSSVPLSSGLRCDCHARHARHCLQLYPERLGAGACTVSAKRAGD